MDRPERLDISIDDGHPMREEQRADVRADLEARLRHRRITLTGQEQDEEIVSMLGAVEEFETAATAAGGDLFVDTPESSQPDDRRLVLPLREHGESAEDYTARVRSVAGRLRRAD
jgi:hypothetical protein